MNVVVIRPIELFDAAKKGSDALYVLTPETDKNTFQIEEVASPFQDTNTWLVLKGTLIGTVKERWKNFEMIDGHIRLLE